MSGCHAATVSMADFGAAPAVATVRQGSLSVPVPAAATVQQQGAFRRLSLPRVYIGEQQIT